ncbi:MAG TPA: aldo/keto reductase [Acetobacteraceae bacterium]|nr:aldo/keto reductase [Acetobacteraceae bacterium]
MTDATFHGPLGMGGAPLGNLADFVPEANIAPTFAAAWEADIRHYDTAPHYGAGLSERRFGDHLRHRPRDAFTLSTKVGRLLEPADDIPEMADNFRVGLPFRRRLDVTAAGARRSIEDSLQRMGLTRIDIVYIHDISEDWLGPGWKATFAEALKGAAVALSELRRQGVIRAWGFGVNLVDPCIAALEQSDPDIFLVAGRYTLLDHIALDKLLPLCAQKGAKVVIGGPYNSGILAGGDTYNYERAPADLLARAKALRETCKRHGVDLKAAALQFCAAHPVVAAVIPGPRSPAEVTENARMMAAPIPGALWAELKQTGLIPAHAPTPAG